MTDLPPDAARAAPDFAATRPDAAPGTPGQEPEPENPEGGSPRAGAAGVPPAATGPESPGTAPATEPVSLVPVAGTRRRRPRPAPQSNGAARATTSERASAMAARFAGGWPFGRIIGIGVLIVALFALLAIGVGGTALANLTTARSHVVSTPVSWFSSSTSSWEV